MAKKRTLIKIFNLKIQSNKPYKTKKRLCEIMKLFLNWRLLCFAGQYINVWLIIATEIYF